MPRDILGSYLETLSLEPRTESGEDAGFCGEGPRYLSPVHTSSKPGELERAKLRRDGSSVASICGFGPLLVLGKNLFLHEAVLGLVLKEGRP